MADIHAWTCRECGGRHTNEEMICPKSRAPAPSPTPTPEQARIAALEGALREIKSIANGIPGSAATIRRLAAKALGEEEG
jgi:hypothetical protein